MAFRLVSSGGVVIEPAAVLMYASGVVRPGSVVIRDTAANAVSPATAALATTTSIVGICLDYAQGFSDTQVRVVPFVVGQLWEADAVNAITTTQLMLRHTLADNVNVRNIVNTYETSSAAVFLAYNMTGLTTGSGKLIGTFLAHTPLRSGAYTVTG